MLRCLGNGIIPVSIRLKNHVRTQRSDNIIQRAERSLLNERIREVNITLDWLKHDTYMYQTKLSAIISDDLMEQCIEFIKEHRESRHKTVMERQIKKYNKLWAQKYESGSNSTYSGNGTGGRSNQDKIGAKCWVVNLSHQPLSQAQEAVLAHGTNFAVTPKTPLQRIYNSSGSGMPKPKTIRSR